MRVIIPVNPNFSGKCGVTDYTLKLVSSLNSSGIETSTPKLFDVFDLIKEKRVGDILHLQYPSLDSRYSLLPQILSRLFAKTIVTFHETLTLNRIRRESLKLFSFKSAIVTNNFDYNYFVKRGYNPALIHKINLGPSFDKVESSIANKNDKIKVCYFGLMRKDKNIDHVAKLFKQLTREDDLNIECHVVCGQPLSGSEKQFEIIRNKFDSNVVWHIGTPTSELGKLLSQFDYAYLPYPNGADENRSSLISILTAGVIPLVYTSNRTPMFMKEGFLCCDSPDSASLLISRDRKQVDYLKGKISHLGDKYRWENIVSEHLNIYNQN